MLLCILTLVADYEKDGVILAFSILKLIPLIIFIPLIGLKLSPKSWLQYCLPEPPIIPTSKICIKFLF